MPPGVHLFMSVRSFELNGLCFCTWSDPVGAVRIVKLHVEDFGSCIVYLKTDGYFMYFSFVVQMFCNKTMMKHRELLKKKERTCLRVEICSFFSIFNVGRRMLKTVLN